MNSLKLSTKHQVVIPKEVRQKLGLKSGHKLYIKRTTKDSILLTTKSPIEKYYGVLKGAWGPDSDKYLRDLRDEWDDDRS